MRRREVIALLGAAAISPFSAGAQTARLKRVRAVQILLGHTKIESTVRYLGVDIEDALALSEATEI
jgi:hypothetical protein